MILSSYHGNNKLMLHSESQRRQHSWLTFLYLLPSTKPIMHWSSNIKVAALKAGLANQEYSKKQKRLMFNYRTVGPSGLKT